MNARHIAVVEPFKLKDTDIRVEEIVKPEIKNGVDIAINIPVVILISPRDDRKAVLYI